MTKFGINLKLGGFRIGMSILFISSLANNETYIGMISVNPLLNTEEITFLSMRYDRIKKSDLKAFSVVLSSFLSEGIF